MNYITVAETEGFLLPLDTGRGSARERVSYRERVSLGEGQLGSGSARERVSYRRESSRERVN